MSKTQHYFMLVVIVPRKKGFYKMYIEVKLLNSSGRWSSRTYTYACDIPDIKVGDIVTAPTSSGNVRGQVARVNVPEYSVSQDILPLLKTITGRAELPPPEPAPEQMGLDNLDSSPEPEPSLALSADVIRVKQLPVIEEQLRAVKTQVEAVTSEAAAMVCTEDTIQAVKTRRAELNKQFSELEARRKEVKAAVLTPYERFEAVFRECITEPFKAADAALKEKISQVEQVQKDECEARLRLHFDELCQVHGVDFIRYEQAGVKIDMASAKAKTPRKLMDQLGEFVAGIAVGADQIRKMDDAPEIMAEYKRCLNVGQAVSVVQERRRRVEEERMAAEAREESRARQEAAVARVEAAAPPEMVEPPEEDPVIERLTFTIVGARKSQLIKLRNYLKTEGLIYE